MTAAQKKKAAEEAAAIANAPVTETTEQITEPLMMRVTKVGKSLKESRAAAPYYFIVETNKLVDIDEVVGTKSFKNTVELAKSFFIWAINPWEGIEVGETYEAEAMARVFKLRL
jgi:hypothetical protein